MNDTEDLFQALLFNESEFFFKSEVYTQLNHIREQVVDPIGVFLLPAENKLFLSTVDLSRLRTRTRARKNSIILPNSNLNSHKTVRVH